MACKSLPIDRHDTFRPFLGTRNDLDPISELVSREPTKALLTKWKPVQSRPNRCLPLACTVVVPRNEPDIPDDFHRHAVAIVLNYDRRIVALDVVQDHPHGLGVRIVRVLDQFEDGKARGAD